MLQKCRKMLKNEKGLTLIELLAVVVILGIIAAIAIPSIGNIIQKSRDDAHVANAQQIMSAARLALANGAVTVSGTADDTIVVKSATAADEKLNDYIDKIDSQYTAAVVNTVKGKVDSVVLTSASGTITIDKNGKKK